MQRAVTQYRQQRGQAASTVRVLGVSAMGRTNSEGIDPGISREGRQQELLGIIDYSAEEQPCAVVHLQAGAYPHLVIEYDGGLVLRLAASAVQLI